MSTRPSQHIGFSYLTDRQLAHIEVSNLYIEPVLGRTEKEINLENQSLTAIPSEIRTRSSLTALILKHNSISFIPDYFTHLRNLNVLNLEDNFISSNPDSLTNLKLLTSIALRRNSLTTLPRIGDYTSLKILDLNGIPVIPCHPRANFFTSISDRIGHYTNLSALHLNSTGIKFISYKIGKLIHLRLIDLGFNNLQVLPASIGNLGYLRSLHLQDNRLTSLPPTFSKLTSLKTLGLKNNRLSSLPPNFFKINFHMVSLVGNPLNSLSLKNFNLLHLKFLSDSFLVIAAGDGFFLIKGKKFILLPQTVQKYNQMIILFPSLQEIAARAFTHHSSERLHKID